MGKTKFAYPVQKICGKISRHSDVVHRCLPGGKGDITYLQGERDLELHPVTSDEIENHATFALQAKQVAARIKKNSPTYETDMGNYRAQLEGEAPIVGFKKYLWSVVKQG